MLGLTFYKKNQLPTTLDPNGMYFIKEPNEGFFNIFITDSNGNPIGLKVLDAYQIWINEGNTGTEQDFLDSLNGADGTGGTSGTKEVSDQLTIIGTGTTDDPFRIPDVFCNGNGNFQNRTIRLYMILSAGATGLIDARFNGQYMTLNILKSSPEITQTSDGFIQYNVTESGIYHVRFIEQVVNGKGNIEIKPLHQIGTNGLSKIFINLDTVDGIGASNTDQGGEITTRLDGNLNKWQVSGEVYEQQPVGFVEETNFSFLPNMNFNIIFTNGYLSLFIDGVEKIEQSQLQIPAPNIAPIPEKFNDFIQRVCQFMEAYQNQ